ncbi:deaminase [Elstera litoralis]|uniref:deaminase n=1 Tax=Elstera litoralis TaxID=552518 RepID=UPI002FC32D7F
MSMRATDQAADERFMGLALRLARRGWGQVWPSVAVGCVLVKDGAIIAQGWTQPSGRPHAEIHALTQAGAAARGATAYVTLEPCAHHGRAGPCCDALVDAGTPAPSLRWKTRTRALPARASLACARAVFRSISG